MAFESLAEIYDAMDVTRSRLVDRVGLLTTDDAGARENPEAWSVTEIVEHLSAVEKQILKLATLMLMKAESAESGPDELSRIWPISLDSIEERSRREKYQAPETAMPKGDASIADSLEVMGLSRESLHGLRSRLETVNGAIVKYPHPVFGPLNLFEWLVMLQIHEERHLRQIDAVLGKVHGAQL